MDTSVIAVTGAAVGIGRAVARRFADAGWFVAALDINHAGVSEFVDEVGEDHALGAELDVRDPQAWQQAMAALADRTGGRLDVLVNNAGVLTSGDFAQTPLEEHHRLFDVNVKGVVNGCHAAFELLRATDQARVINVASASAIYGTPHLATYSATKFAVRGLTEALDLEWEPYGIRVSDVWPLFVDTDMAKGMEHEGPNRLGIHLSPVDVANSVWHVAHDRRPLRPVHHPVGLQAKVLMPASKYTPAFLLREIMRRVSQ